MSTATRWTREEKIKRGVWAVAFAACIFVGSITGAQLKTDKQKDEVSFPAATCFRPIGPRLITYGQAIRQFRETSPAEQIAMLEEQKKLLLDQKAGFQRKLDLFHERVRERAEEANKKGRGS